MRKCIGYIRRFPQIIFRLLLSLSASFYVVVIFLIKQKITIPCISHSPEYVSYLIYLIIPIIIAFGCLLASKNLSAYGVECEIKEVELASHSFLANYLGYFFVGLSIPNITTLIYVYIVILIFTHLSHALSFNPMFLLFGYQFYFVTGLDGTKIFLITKQDMKCYKDAELNDLRKINDFTFIDMR